MKWASVFKYLSINYSGKIAEFSDCTQKLSFYNNLNGNRLRIHLSNQYSSLPLLIKRITAEIRTQDTDSIILKITKDGHTSIRLEPGHTMFTDEIEAPVRAGDIISVYLYLEERQAVESIRCFWSDTGAKVQFMKGDCTGGREGTLYEPEDVLPLISEDPGPVRMKYFFGLDAVQVYTGDDVRVIAAFGDSITHMSFFTNALAKRLYSDYPGRVTLINCGIGGNRLVHDATFVKQIQSVIPVFGDAGVRRFEKNVYETDNPDTVISLIGINDIMHPVQLEEKTESTSPEDIIEGYRKIASIAHEHGSIIFEGTVMPCGNDSYPEGWLETFEKTRLPLNEWIRKQDIFDGYFDYDEVMRNPENPGFLTAGLHIGDGLHPNDSGGKQMLKAIDFNKLMKEMDDEQLNS